MSLKNVIIISIISLLFIYCGNKQDNVQDEPMTELNKELQDRIDLYAPVEITADISSLSANQKKMIELLLEAGQLADEVFWMQTSPCAIQMRDSLRALNTPEAKQALDFFAINYGPYDRIENKRFIGEGPAKRPEGGTF